ncbi:MAG: hypothetical protein ACLVCA_02060 [Peptoniphilus sp.]|uniref:hypothetical protein n=1 Tax=Peptoniphilus sp. TaxID=1971214 RepID=UPI00399A7B95
MIKLLNKFFKSIQDFLTLWKDVDKIWYIKENRKIEKFKIYAIFFFILAIISKILMIVFKNSTEIEERIIFIIIAYIFIISSVGLICSLLTLLTFYKRGKLIIYLICITKILWKFFTLLIFIGIVIYNLIDINNKNDSSNSNLLIVKSTFISMNMIIIISIFSIVMNINLKDFIEKFNYFEFTNVEAINLFIVFFLTKAICDIITLLIIKAMYCFSIFESVGIKSSSSKNIYNNQSSLLVMYLNYRTQLLSLIILFICAVFLFPDENSCVAKFYTNLINVVTIYTLIMLYLDKRKEWS